MSKTTLNRSEQSSSGQTAYEQFRRWQARNRHLNCVPDADAVADPDRNRVNNRQLATSEGNTPLIERHRQQPVATELDDDRRDHWGAYVACGCGWCDDNEDISDVCPHPQPPTLAEATDTTQALVRAETGFNPVTHPSQRYREFIEGDHQLGGTDRFSHHRSMALLTFRLSPLASDDGIFTPSLVLRDKLRETWTHVYRYLRRTFGDLGLEYEYATVVSGTQQWATPHLHVLVHFEDPWNKVEVADLDYTVSKHIECHQNATEYAHPVDPDGDGGAIIIDHNPTIAEEVSLNFIRHHSDMSTNGITALTTYVATQMPNALIWHPLDRDGSAPRWAWETATWSRLSLKDSVTTSRGWPNIDED